MTYESAVVAYNYRDLNMLFAANPISGDVSTIQDIEAIKASVIHLVLTKHYERLWHPELGCNATALLFENQTPITASLLEASIRDVIRNFEPRVNLQQVNVYPGIDQDGFRVDIIFYAKNVAELITINYFLQRVR